MSFRTAARTHVGCVRDSNEDAHLVVPSAWLAVVADGMGGHAAGEVASAYVIEAFTAAAARLRDGHGDPAEVLRHAVGDAERAIGQHAEREPAAWGLGTTVTALWVSPDRIAHLQHIGDSRCYRLRQGQLEQRSTDHSVVGMLVRSGVLTREEAAHHPQRHALTRCLGGGGVESDTGDITRWTVLDGDRYLLVSDGVTDMLSDAEIAALARRHALPDACADALVDAAIAAGGQDNITVVVMDF